MLQNGLKYSTLNTLMSKNLKPLCGSSTHFTSFAARQKSPRTDSNQLGIELCDETMSVQIVGTFGTVRLQRCDCQVPKMRPRLADS